MSIFSKVAMAKKSMWDKVLSRNPKENVLYEINTLLINNENDLTNIPLKSVENIAKKYDVNLFTEFKEERTRIYIEYLIYCMDDMVLTDDEIKNLKHLGILLHLKEKEVSDLLTGAKFRAFKNEMLVKFSDLDISEEDKKDIDRLKTSLQIEDEKIDEYVSALKNSILEDYVSLAIADERLSNEEVNHINKIIESLEIDRPNITNISRSDFEKFQLYWKIENNEIPEIESDISLQKGEKLYEKRLVSWYETRKVMKRVDYGHLSTNIKIVKGVNFRLGSIKARPITEDEMQEIDSGTVYLTNRRLLFIGQNNNKTINLSSVLKLNIFSNGIDIQKDKGKSPFLEFKDGIETFSLILNTLITN